MAAISPYWRWPKRNSCAERRYYARVHSRSTSLHRWLLGAAAVAPCLFAVAEARATVYEVAQSGSDAGIPDGTAAHPFLTISACAQIAQAGDTCLVHAGTYRETVSPAASGTAAAPVRFVVADGECVTVSGAEPLGASFTAVGGNVWVASVPDPIEQMFSRGTMIWEAQWPNRTPGALFDVPKGVTGQGTGVFTTGDGGSISLLIDPNIPPGDWTGAVVFILPGYRWQSDSRPVAAYDPTSHTITLDTTVPWAEKATQPLPANPYYLFGSPLALDVQDEWVTTGGADGGAYTLSYYSADDPSNHGLEYKKRLYAFDVARSYVDIVGFHVFGAAVRLVGNGNVVDSLSIEYPTHLRAFDAYYTDGDVNRIVGDDNVWKNTIVEKSGSAGLVVAGNGNVVENTIANDIAYQATNHAGFDMYDYQASYRGNVFAYNTVNRSGRGGIFQYGSKGGRVVLNSVSQWALLTSDMGGIYAWGTDGEGTEIAYNDVGGSTAFWSNGIYLDDGTKHFIAHHNFVHDSTFYGFCIKEENDYWNNTLANVGTPFLVANNAQNGRWENTNLAKVQNDVGDGTFLVRVGLLPTVVTDYGYFEAPVQVTGDWRRVEIPFASMHQPLWFVQEPFDLSSVQEIAFTPWTNGDFELDIDNLTLEGTTPLLLDTFDAPGAANGLGGYAWGGGSGNGGMLGTTVVLTYTSGGPAGSTSYAALAGTIVLGDSSWGVLTESLSSSDLSMYTGISFDVRGRTKGLRVLATGGSPIQDHNDSCALSGMVAPACAIGRGAVIPGIAVGVDGGPPDLGAFPSAQPPWQAGAQRPNDPSVCGKIADLDAALPPPIPNPWGDGGGGSDGGPDATKTSDASTGGGADGGTPESASGKSGCACRVKGRGEPDRERATFVLAIVALTWVRRCRKSAAPGRATIRG
jgi:hypothetical protein